MKTPLSILAFLVIAFTPLDAKDSRYFSYIIRSTDAAFQYDLPSDLYVSVVNFSQSSVSNLIGSVTVTKNGASASAMTANSTNPVFIAGPCTITVAPVQGQTLFVTFLLGRN